MIKKGLSIEKCKTLENDIDKILKSLETFTQQDVSLPIGLRVQLGIVKGYLAAMNELAVPDITDVTTAIFSEEEVVKEEVAVDDMLPPSAKLVKTT